MIARPGPAIALSKVSPRWSNWWFMIRVNSHIRIDLGYQNFLVWLTSAHVRILQKPSINQLFLKTPLTSYLKGGDFSLRYQAIDSKLVDFQIPRHLFSSEQNFLHDWLRYGTIRLSVALFAKKIFPSWYPRLMSALPWAVQYAPMYVGKFLMAHQAKMFQFSFVTWCQS